MKLATIDLGGRPTAATILPDGSAIILERAAPALKSDLPADTVAALATGDLHEIIASGLNAADAGRAIETASAAGQLSEAAVSASDVHLLAPLPYPRKNVFCVGRNYLEHIAEGERAQNKKIGVTEHPVFFTKLPTSVVGPGADVPIFPHVSENIDYEVELAVVIGKAGRNISPDQAMAHIFGYTIVNDVTARDVQRRHGGQYFKGKGLDGSCPMGPVIVTADALGDPTGLGIRLTVNDETRQDGNTADMIFDIPTLIASLSEGMTLEPGDVLATGTPSGVGYAMDPPVFLKDGDVVVCDIDGIGKLENRMTIAA